MLGGSGAYASSLRKFCAIWCVLVYILIRLCLEKFPKHKHYFYIKNNYDIGIRLLWGT